MKIVNYFVVISIILFSNACKTSENISAIDYKIEVGQNSLYKISTETYSISKTPDTTIYYIQENVVDKKTENGVDIFTIEQYKKSKLTDNWSSNAVFTVKQSSSEIIRLENSLPLKIIHKPIFENATWNLNEYNNQKEVILKYSNLGQSYKTLSPTFQVFQDADSSLISLTKHFSVYSPSNGLIYKESTALNYCQTTPDCIGKGLISYGTREIWTKLN